MSKFTAGPWAVDGKGSQAFVRANDLRIVSIRHRLDGDEHEANARLIAAAPCMLEALQDALCALECCGKVSPVATKASAAIAKATGEAP